MEVILPGTNAECNCTSGAILILMDILLATGLNNQFLSGTGIASIGAFINSSNSSPFTGALTLVTLHVLLIMEVEHLTLSGNISGNFALTFVTVGGITQSSASVWSGTGTLLKKALEL